MKNSGQIARSKHLRTLRARSRIKDYVDILKVAAVGIHFQRFLPWHVERLLLNKCVLDALRLRRLCKRSGGSLQCRYPAPSPLLHDFAAKGSAGA